MVLRPDVLDQNTERSLLSAASQLDGTALLSIFDTYVPGVIGYAQNFLWNPADIDSLIDRVFHDLLLSFQSGNGPTDELRVHIYREAYEILCQRPESVSLAMDPTNSDHPEDTLTLAGVLRMTRTVDERHSIALLLEGFNPLGIAAIMGITPQEAESLQESGLEQLRTVLLKDGG
jgi:hypothetical protein